MARNKLTATQRRALDYFRELADGVPFRQRRGKYPKMAVKARLAEAGWIRLIGQYYGPIYAITDAGRAMLAADAAPPRAT